MGYRIKRFFILLVSFTGIGLIEGETAVSGYFSVGEYFSVCESLNQTETSLRFSGEIPQTDTISQVIVSGLPDTVVLSNFITSYHKDSLKKAWFRYLSLLNRDIDAGSSSNASVKVDTIIFSFHSSSDTSIGDYGSDLRDSVRNIQKGGYFPEPEMRETSSAKAEIPFSDSVTEGNFRYIFGVQIAASRYLLDTLSLSRIYKGPLEIVHRYEEGWHRYQVGFSPSYITALDVLSSIGTKESFIVAYNERGEKEKLWKAILFQRNNSVEYRVQIAASKEQLTDVELREIYEGSRRVTEIEEEGWYKYQIAVGSNYQLARRVIEEIDVEGAFLVAYLDGRKIQLYKVLKFYDL